MFGIKSSKKTMSIVLIILPLIVFSISIMTGRYSISLGQFIEIVISKITGSYTNTYSDAGTVLFSIRLPRIFAAMLIGAALSISGAVYQGMFRNPMVSPDILGASAGAGFGAALAILLSFNSFEIQITSFIFGLVGVCMSYFISKITTRGGDSVLVLVLTGMVISTLFQSFISLSKYAADPYSKLPAITFWLMGGLSTITMDDIKMILIPFLIGGVPLFLIRWKINVISFGDEEAMALGIDTTKFRIMIIICSTLLTSASVSVSGMIGWIGLVIPHLARMIVGPNYKVLVPTVIFIGSAYVLLVDDVARSLFSMEIPLGILTLLIGAPFFIYLLIKGKKSWIWILSEKGYNNPHQYKTDYHGYIADSAYKFFIIAEFNCIWYVCHAYWHYKSYENCITIKLTKGKKHEQRNSNSQSN